LFGQSGGLLEISRGQRPRKCVHKNPPGGAVELTTNMRRFTRLTNAFSKKIENHEHCQKFFVFALNAP
jgi:hypothetical protein